MVTNDELNPTWFLGPDGPVARQMNSYEQRPQQLQLARAIDDSLIHSQHLVAEAGTGIGKSFAYIIPTIRWALENEKKAVISTYTISLQEQLVQKDIPFIKRITDVDFRVSLAKGRGNYLCWRRLQQARKRGSTLFDDGDHLNLVEDIYQWALQTHDGTLSTLARPIPSIVWDMVCSDSHNCSGRKCDHFSSCFYQNARRHLFGSNIIIANHALLFSDLALRERGGKVLPNFEVVILDEAHNVEKVAGDHFGLRLSNFQVRFLLNRLFNPKTEKGILAAHRKNLSTKLLAHIHQSVDSFYQEVLNFYDAQHYSGDNGRIRKSQSFADVLSAPLNELGAYLDNLAQDITEETERLEIKSYAKRSRDFALLANVFVNQDADDYVYWVEANQNPRYRRAVICASPLDVGPTLKKVLFDQYPSVIMTSATLSTKGKSTDQIDSDNNQGFSFFAERLGLQDFQTLQLGSPFDFQRQVEVYVEAYLPEARGQEEEFLIAASEAVKKYLIQSQGKAFVLFTNYKHLRQMAQRLEDFAGEHDFPLLIQGQGKDRSTLLNEFRQDTHSVLLGTDSFWQGVDVPGESLSNVIIVKLPFAVPDHPLLQARLEKINAEGRSGFFEYQLPEAILKFKQGFGRLIRTNNDRGIVVILDSRVVTKNYGRAFLNVLPPCPVHIIKKLPE